MLFTNHRRRPLMKKALAIALFLGTVFPAAGWAESPSLAKFDGGIGVIPVSVGVAVPPTPATALTVESVNRNIVRGVQPPGQIWVISGLKADVKVDGSIKVDGRGLLLGGGNGIGTNANAKVFATLICTAADGTFTLHSTDSDNDPTNGNQGVPLEPNGDFRIDDLLSPAPPNPCVGPVLLIRNQANQAWFAAGIPKL
jgi:hypothetical protein